MRKNAPPPPSESPGTAFSKGVRSSEVRKLRSKREGVHGIWFHLGMFGLIGWTVAIPTVLGALLGVYLDKHYPSVHSWTLTLLLIGLLSGCVYAWHWVASEEKNIRKDEENIDE